MSGRFVSAGTAEEPPERDDEWLQAQQELDASARRKKENESGLQDGGKSLYEVLQANKAAKQEAFEEAARLKNQFRSLDEDEVDFLDSVLESTRAKDQAVRKETTEQLSAFRRHQEEAEKSARSEQPEEAEDIEEQWQINNKKRKKDRDGDSKRGFKIRRASSTDQTANASMRVGDGGSIKTSGTKSSQTASEERKGQPVVAPSKASQTAISTASISPEPSSKTISPQKASPVQPTSGLGLVDYSSESD